jgi:hypothetical protein
MEISELTLKFIIVLIPGAIASIIFEKLTIHKKWNPFQFIANSILFGGTSYLLAQLILNYNNTDAGLKNFWANLSTKEIPFSATYKATIVAFILSFICAAIDYHKLINRFARRIGVTNKYGDENLYSYLLNARNVNEVYVRDIANQLTYFGIIDSFSEKPTFKELVLRAVKIYDYKTSVFLYEVDKIYISRPTDDITIEIPFININNQTNGTETNIQTSE